MFTSVDKWQVFPAKLKFMAGQMAVRYVQISQICLYGFLTVCTLLLPHFLFERNEGGVSNFGVHAVTAIPYSLAFGLGGIYMLRAAAALPSDTRSKNTLRYVLTALGVLMLLVLATTYPYKVNSLFDNFHIAVSELYFFAEFTAGIWFAAYLSRNTINFLLMGLQIIGLLLALFTLLGLLHILFLSQIMAGGAFAILMVRSVSNATIH